MLSRELWESRWEIRKYFPRIFVLQDLRWIWGNEILDISRNLSWSEEVRQSGQALCWGAEGSFLTLASNPIFWFYAIRKREKGVEDLKQAQKTGVGLWFDIGIWPPPIWEFLLEIRKSAETIHVIYFWKALGTRTPMTMFWSVRHANTQIQIHIQIHNLHIQVYSIKESPHER